jgi:2'-5' RNA ligase
MRLFTAIDLTDDARAAVVAEQERLRRALREASLKWARPEQLHLTLVFIGEVDEPRPVIDALGTELPVSPFRLGLGGVSMFPARGAPRVLWLGAVEGATETIDLHRLVAQRLESCGVPRTSQAFQPHLTLARWRESRSSDRRAVAGFDATRVAAVPVIEVTIYQSRLSPSGSVYTPLARTRLAGPGPAPLG